MKVLVTGAAGFIGYHLCKKFIENNFPLIGVDNLNSYYDKNLKFKRLEDLKSFCASKKKDFNFKKIDLQDKSSLEEIFKKHKITHVVNLAAQAGVRYSLENPHAYIESNILGFLNILELSRTFKVKHLVYASSSSVYGGNTKMPFSEDHGVDHPVSMYAVTKRSNELMAHSYSHLYKLPTTGLRFFTVYGPWGRPDMAPMKFANAIISNQPIEIYNHGNMYRDFTYIDDITKAICDLMHKPPSKDNLFDKTQPDLSKSWSPYRIFNIGNNKPIYLLDFIKKLEKELGKEAKKKYLEIQPGDVKKTHADITQLQKYIDYKPETTIEVGIKKFINWFKIFYEIK